ncbi:MAG: hypothetical protein VX473_03430 [Candidatus Thermoplasmatota archaeon]|nr:hypothetical protein [Candidatus Thermoplasmatota archaeon]
MARRVEDAEGRLDVPQPLGFYEKLQADADFEICDIFLDKHCGRIEHDPYYPDL